MARKKNGAKERDVLLARYLDENNSLLKLPQAEMPESMEEPFPDPEEVKAARNIHADHRKRLRQRFLNDHSFENFSDREILELLLFYAQARMDTAPVAQALLDEFDTLKNVLEAPPESLIDVHGIGEQAATLISMVVPLARVWERCAMKNPTRIGNCRDAERYCQSLLMAARNEQFYVICLNAQCQLVGKKRITEGTLSEVAAYPRSVVETALNHNAHSVLLSHNHPGGTCAPSAEDISSTVQIQRLLHGLGIMVLDHIIVAGAQTYSMIQHGDIDYRVRNR